MRSPYRGGSQQHGSARTIKRNARFIQTHRMLDFDAPLPGREGILCRKAHCRGEGKWLYSFRDAEKAAAEERSWLAKASAQKTYNQAEFERRRRQFGTIVLECDPDLPPETVCKAYEERWKIEIVMRYYKNACGFDETRVQDDWSVIGSEFCAFLASVLTLPPPEGVRPRRPAQERNLFAPALGPASGQAGPLAGRWRLAPRQTCPLAGNRSPRPLPPPLAAPTLAPQTRPPRKSPQPASSSAV